MNHRIFIAINLPQPIKKRMQQYQNKWYDLPVRWTRPENLHITLVFIGYVSDEEMLEVCQGIKDIAKNHEPFIVNFNKIALGPPGKPPRMIWMEGKDNKEMADLKSGLEEKLLNSNSGFYEKDTRPLHPHVTVARVKQGAWRDMSEAPNVEEKFNTDFNVDNIEVVESVLGKEGPEYTVLESVDLGK